MAKHTPGPWKVSSSGHIVARDERRTVIAACAGNILNESVAADMRLIAAAPDLFDALKDFMDGDGDVHAKVLAARAALMKAEGC